MTHVPCHSRKNFVQSTESYKWAFKCAYTCPFPMIFFISKHFNWEQDGDFTDQNKPSLLIKYIMDYFPLNN